MKKGLSILAATCVLAAVSSGSVLAKPVPGSVLRKVRGVHTAYWKGKKARVQIFANGTLRARHTNKVDVGRWSVRGNVFCVSFRVWTHGKSKCGTVESRGGWYVGLRNSKGVPRLKLRK